MIAALYSALLVEIGKSIRHPFRQSKFVRWQRQRERRTLRTRRSSPTGRGRTWRRSSSGPTSSSR